MVMSMDLHGSFLKPAPSLMRRVVQSANAAARSAAALKLAKSETGHTLKPLSPVAWAGEDGAYACLGSAFAASPQSLASLAPDRSLLFAPAGDKENAHPSAIGGRARAASGRDDGAKKKTTAAKKVQSATVRDAGNRSPRGKGKAHPASASVASATARRLTHGLGVGERERDDTTDDESLALAEGKLRQLERLAVGHMRARGPRDPPPGLETSLDSSMSDIEASFMLRQVRTVPIDHSP